MCTSNVTPKGFFLRVHTYFSMTASEKESVSLSINMFEDFDIIVTKEAWCKTDATNGFTGDRKQNCSNCDLTLVIALKEHLNSLK